MAVIDDGFEAGVLVLEGETGTSRVLITTGTNDPSIGFGETAPVGSLFFRQVSATVGELYLKKGSADVDWEFVDVPGRIQWKGTWVQTQYLNNDMVIDGSWTMIANKTTSDRAAPQPIGQQDVEPLTSTIWATNSFTGIVKMVHKYTMIQDGWLQELRIRTAFWDLDVVTRITLINITTGVTTVYNNPILTDDNWTTLATDNIIMSVGDQVEIWYEYYNASAANNVTGGWTSNTGTGIPSTQEFNIDNLSTPTVIEIHHTDLDSNSRATELDGIVSNSIITITETSDASRSIEVEVTAVDVAAANSTKYTVTVIQNGSKNIRNNKTCIINIDVPITQPSAFNYNVNYWTTTPSVFATMTSALYFDGALQADIDDAYGIELTFQNASFSLDWDVVSTSFKGGGGSSGGGTIAVVDNLTSTSTTDALSANQGRVLELTKEPIISPKNSGFNNLYGSISGTVSEGNHTHPITPADFASVTVGFTTVDPPIQLVMTDIPWDVTHLQNNTTVIEHDAVNTERMLIKETGLYILAFAISFDADPLEEQISSQVLVDGTTILPGSFRLASEDDEINDLSNCFTATLTSGSYITLQIMANGTGNVLHNSTNFMVTRASATKGDTGPTGSGSTITVQDDGINVANTPHSTLNFVNMISTDAGGGVVDITPITTPADFASVTVGFTTVDPPIPLVMTDIPWDVTHLQNNTTVIEHDAVNTERMLIKETGLYILAFAISFDADPLEEQISAQILVDGTTILPGSFRLASEDDEINDLSNCFTGTLTSGSYITLQIMANGTGNVLHNSTNFMVTRASAVKGDTGPTGSGSTITVQDDGINVTNTPHSTLNFVNMTSTDAGGGIVDITPLSISHLFRHNGAVTQSFTALTTINFGTSVRNDAAFTHAVVGGGSEITINTAGWYKLSYDVSYDDGTNGRTSSTTEFQLNGVVVAGSLSYAYHRNAANGTGTATATIKLNLSVSDVIRVQGLGTNTIVTIADSCRLNIETLV